MRPYGTLITLWLLTLLWGCSNTILVPVPPRMDLKQYGTIGLRKSKGVGSLCLRTYFPTRGARRSALSLPSPLIPPSTLSILPSPLTALI